MTFRPLACTLALGLICGLATTAADAQKRDAAKPQPASACSDFYASANAGWLQANPLPPGAVSVSALGQLQQLARTQQIDLLNGAMQAPQGEIQKLLGDFWASGINEPGVERDGAYPIAPLLQRIDAIRRSKDVAPAIAALHQVGLPVAFAFGADIDLQAPTRHIGYFSQGGLGLPDPAYYTRTDTDTRALLGQYNLYVQKILALTGIAADDVAEQAQLVIDLETRLAQQARPLPQLRDPRGNYAPVAVATLAAQYPQLQLGEFLAAQGLTFANPAGDIVSIANPARLAQVDALVKSLKPAQWRAYLRWRVGDAMAPYLAKAWRDAHFDFRGRVLAGASAPAPREQQVLDAINQAAGPMLGHEYVARHLPAANRARAQEIALQVRDALAAALQRDPRLDPPARAEAAAKLARLRIEVGAPARELDYTAPPMGRGSYGGNMLIASTWRHREEMKRIGSGLSEPRWDVLPQQPVLAYDLARNRLLISAAMLQAPVLDMLQEAAVQYGAFGALVGHELSHGFDDRGRTVDAAGMLRDWWTPAASSAWAALGHRVAAQYGTFAYPGLEAVQLDGVLTGAENLADLAGVELAWAAYRDALPESDPASQKAFHAGWAKLWPEHVSTEAAIRRAASSVHAPGQWRANGPLINQASFGALHGCKAGTPMQIAADARITVWPAAVD